MKLKKPKITRKTFGPIRVCFDRDELGDELAFVALSSNDPIGALGCPLHISKCLKQTAEWIEKQRES